MNGTASQTLAGGFWATCANRLYAPRITAFVLSAIVLFAAAFRLWDLGGPSFWMDELFSVAFADRPQHQLWSNWMVRETNPPLYYSLLREWMHVFGRGEFEARALAVTFGVLSIPIMYLVGRRAHSHEAGLVSALLTAVSSQHLQFSQQARGYALGFLAAATAIYALLRLTDRWLDAQPSHGRGGPELAVYGAAASVAIYTHTTFVLLPLLANLYIAWLWGFRTRRSWAALGAWVLANAAILIICSWWLWISFLQISTEGGAQPVAWMEMPSVPTALLWLQRLFSTRKFEMANYLFDVIFVVAALWGLSRIRMEKRVLLVTVCIGVPVLLYLVSFKQPVYLERTIFWAQAAYIPALATGAVTFPSKRFALPVTVAIASVWFLDAVVWRRQHYVEPWREIGRVVAARADRDDVLMAESASALVDLDYYCSQRCAELPRVALKRPAAQEVLRDDFDGTEVGPSDIREALKGVDRVWVMHRGRGRKLEQVLARAAVLEDNDVLESDPLVDIDPAREGQMHLSRWRVKAPNE